MFRFLLVASAFIACTFAAALNSDALATGTTSSEIYPDGQYRNSLETSNGIAAQEQGIGGVNAVGGYSYYSPEGILVQISYVADENGFQPQGELLPTPPPVPVAIQKSLEYIRTHPQYEEPQGQIQRQVQRQPIRQPLRQAPTYRRG